MKEPMTQFDDLNLIDPLLRAVEAEGYDVPTPIQVQAIPPILGGNDVLGCAQTGTGKTAAFALPMLQRLTASGRSQQAAPQAERPAQPGHRGHGRDGRDGRGQTGPSRPIRALILTPTRELAAQIAESFTNYGRHLDIRNTVVFGGVGKNPQIDALRRGVDVLVATPGRLLDLAADRAFSLDQLEIFVLDEADRMLDMGFIHDVRRVIAMLPARRQTLFFSATMPPEIQRLADSILSRPVRVEVTPVATTAERIEQRVIFAERGDKRALLEDVLQDESIRRVLVFTRTKHGANRVAEQLNRVGIGAAAIHGNKSQGARERALAEFKQGTTRVLVATDIAARGLDIDDVTHVINYDLPNVPESYVHRIGRTARAGASGMAISFCDAEERAYLADIERLIRMRVPTMPTPPRSAASASSASGAGPARPAPRMHGEGSERRTPQQRPTHTRPAHHQPRPAQGAPRSPQPQRPGNAQGAQQGGPRPGPSAPREDGNPLGGEPSNRPRRRRRFQPRA